MQSLDFYYELSFLKVLGSVEFSNVFVNMTVAVSIDDGFGITPVSSEATIDSNSLLVRLRTDTDAKIGTKIMSEVKKNETNDILKQSLESLSSEFSTLLGSKLTCGNEMDTSKVSVPMNISGENVYFSFGGSIDSNVPADSILISEASILQQIQSELPLTVGDHNITEVQSFSMN